MVENIMAPPKKKTKKAESNRDTATIRVPVRDVSSDDTGYRPQTFFSAHVGSLTEKQSINLKRLLLGLQASHATVPTPSRPHGKHVDSVGDVIRWFLENLS